MSILWTITAYAPSIGGAQLHLHELVKRITRDEQGGVIYQWDRNRADWLLGTTLRAPTSRGIVDSYDGVPVYQLGLNQHQRRRLRLSVWTYHFLKDAALDRVSAAIRDSLTDSSRALFGSPPSLIHNSRVGREGLTLASLRFAQSLDVPFVLTPNHHHHWRGWFYRHYLDIYRQADALIAQTEIERTELVELGVARDRIHVLGVGPILAPEWDGSRFRAQIGIPSDAPLILFLGQKYAYKRYELLLKSLPSVWKVCPGVCAAFVGPRTAHSRRVFARFRDPRVFECDSVDLQMKTDALAACDVLCVPSAKESFGGVYVEAWSFGKPVIGGDAPAVQEVIEDGVNGYRVGSNPDLLTQRLISLLIDPDLRHVLGEAGRKKTGRYQWGILEEQLSVIYSRLR